MQKIAVGVVTPEEAHERLSRYAWSLYVKQYEAKFIIRDVRSDVLLRNEILAYWEGRIDYISGWTDILGQISRWFWDTIYGALRWLWDTIVKPGIDFMLGGLRWAFDLAISGVKWVVDGISWTLRSVWDHLVSIG